MTGTLRRLSALLISALITTAAYGQTAATSTVAPSTSTIDNRDSRETREELRRILERYPPEVGKVLKLDSSLFGNEAYLTNYPALAAFVAQHPEVAHSPRFFLDSVWIPGDSTPEGTSERIWSRMMEGLMIFAVMLTFAGVLIWLVRTVIAHRKWSRLSRVQAEVHTKLLDRFASSEEVLAYIQTPPGKRFLESAPIPLDEGPQVSPPINRILWSVQVGLVLAMAGLGLFFVSNNVEKDVAPPLFAMGILALSVGGGFVLSAIVSYAISRRLGVWPSGQARLAE